jgi:uncharacterized protein YpmB
MKITTHSRYTQLGLAGLGIILAVFIIHAFTSSVAVAQPATAGKAVAYKVVKMNVDLSEPASVSFIETQLISYGMAGWHLVAIDHSLYIFSK